jgi:iron complex transport system ATP-binding protein
MLLKVENASFRYPDGRYIFQNINFSLNAGQTLSILGANGSGKSTLLNCLANLLKLSSGKIFLCGKPQREYRTKEIAKIIGYVPQLHVSAYGYTVRDFVVMGCAPHMGLFSIPGKKEYKVADEAIERMGISHLAHRPYTEISGGERQQATIARVIVQQPKIIMMDEPTSALDFGNQLRTINLVRDLSKQGYAVIMTTHTPDHAIMLDDTIAIMDRRGTLQTGKTFDIMREETLKEVYQADFRMIYVPEIGRMACLADNSRLR